MSVSPVLGEMPALSANKNTSHRSVFVLTVSVYSTFLIKQKGLSFSGQAFLLIVIPSYGVGVAVASSTTACPAKIINVPAGLSAE